MTPTATKRRLRRLDYGGPIITQAQISPAATSTARPLQARAAPLPFVLVGGALGAASREALSMAWPTPTGGFPAATLAINLAGAFVLGILLEALMRPRRDDAWRQRARLFLGTGFCGAFTTYSTLAIQTVQLARHSAWGTGALYLGVSVVGGLLTATAGIRAGAARSRTSVADLPIDPDTDGGDGSR